MHIEDSAVFLSSTHTKLLEHQRAEVARPAAGAPNRNSSQDAARGGPRPVADARVRISDEAVRLQTAQTASASATLQEAEEVGCDAASSCGDARLNVARLILQEITGRALDLAISRWAEDASTSPPAGARRAETGERRAARRVDVVELSHEMEQVRFAAEGIVRTADGRELGFDMELRMTRERVEVTALSVGPASDEMTDPLVVSFDGQAAALLGEEGYDFDLNGDGVAERVSFLRPGSSYLVLDRNGDGIVNNGTELFGPTTGDGFRELVSYDTDGNGWIDGADPVFGRLQLYAPDASGRGKLTPLSESPAGALYLESAATPFELQDAAGESLGRVRESSVVLGEDGSAVGVLQEIDLVT